MRTRSQARRRRQPQVRQTSVESSNLEKPDNPPIVTMADNRTMAQLLEAPTEGYEDAIVIPEITAANEITRFQQKFDETFYEAWDRFNDLLRGCPHHGFSELHQLDTFYNALNSIDQDSLNSAAGGNFLDKIPSRSDKIIEEQVLRTQRHVSGIKFSQKEPKPSFRPVKAIEQRLCNLWGRPLRQFQQANSGYRPPMASQNQIRPPCFPPFRIPSCNSQTISIEEITSIKTEETISTKHLLSSTGTLPGNTVTNPKEDLKGITTRSGVTIQGPKQLIMTPRGPRNFQTLSQKWQSHSYFEPIVSTASPKSPLLRGQILRGQSASRSKFWTVNHPTPLPNQEQYLPGVRKELKLCEAKIVESSVDEPPEVELKELPPHLEYAFLEGDRQIPIDPKDQEKTTFTCPYGTFAYRRMPFGLCNAPGTFQRCMMAIFHDMIEKTMEVFMDDFSVFGDSFSTCLSHLEKMLKRCEDTNLSLNWEKSHFMVKEGIVLGHKISKSGLEVDRAKVEVIAKLPHPTTVKGVRSFLGHAGFYRRFIQEGEDFSKIARPMTHLLEKETPFFFSEECIESFNTLKRKLTEAPILIAPDWDLPFELMCDASDFAIGAVLGQRKNKHFQPIHYASKTITKLKLTTLLPIQSTPWFGAYYANTRRGKFVIKGMTSQQGRGKEDPSVSGQEALDILKACPQWTHWDTMVPIYTGRKGAIPVFKRGNGGVSRSRMRGRVDELVRQNGLKQKRSPPMMPEFLQRSELKVEPTHRLSTAYHPQTSGQVEVSIVFKAYSLKNRGEL
ncbi:reverse transcriptase domain-containing protein [Tanacetum coccineum]|uniref:Reverse transcriptase domain-containing protein n=1 Tax=Tanacetum coccineum TaxID=301880 RepID=A0ABQ4XEP7_9ASTR